MACSCMHNVDILYGIDHVHMFIHHHHWSDNMKSQIYEEWGGGSRGASYYYYSKNCILRRRASESEFTQCNCMHTAHSHNWLISMVLGLNMKQFFHPK